MCTGYMEQPKSLMCHGYMGYMEKPYSRAMVTWRNPRRNPIYVRWLRGETHIMFGTAPLSKHAALRF